MCLNSKNGTIDGTSENTEDGLDRKDNKQPRKKRGRYRQYDHEIMEEAFAMVMSGKMSVSKAQGIYGVPHSTLEYKVKERSGTLKTPPKKKLRLYFQSSNGETDVENRLMDMGRGKERVRCMERAEAQVWRRVS